MPHGQSVTAENCRGQNIFGHMVWVAVSHVHFVGGQNIIAPKVRIVTSALITGILHNCHFTKLTRKNVVKLVALNFFAKKLCKLGISPNISKISQDSILINQNCSIRFSKIIFGQIYFRIQNSKFYSNC